MTKKPRRVRVLMMPYQDDDDRDPVGYSGPATVLTGLPRTIRRHVLRLIVPLADSTIYEMEKRGDFPRRFNLTPQCVGWDLEEVETWLEQRRQTYLNRERVGRDASPTAAVLDAQSALSGGVGVKGVHGHDAGKKVTGHKHHALVDADRRLLLTSVSPASLHDSRGGAALLTMSRCQWPFLVRCFADRAYAGSRVAQASPVAVTLVGSAPGQKGFAVQPRRWVVERSFAWFGRCRRLARDHEATVSSAVAFFTLAAAMILVRRLAQPL